MTSHVPRCSTCEATIVWDLKSARGWAIFERSLIGVPRLINWHLYSLQSGNQPGCAKYAAEAHMHSKTNYSLGTFQLTFFWTYIPLIVFIQLSRPKHWCFSSLICTLTGCGSSLSTAPEGRIPLRVAGSVPSKHLLYCSNWQSAEVLKFSSTAVGVYFRLVSTLLCQHLGFPLRETTCKLSDFVLFRGKGVFLWNLRNFLSPVLVEQSTGCERGRGWGSASKQLHCSYSWTTTSTLL